MTAQNATIIFDAQNFGIALLITMFSGRNPRFEIVRNGTLERTVPASSAWAAQKKELIEWARTELDLMPSAPSTPGELTAITPGELPVTDGKRISRLACLIAQNMRDSGRAATDDELITLARGRAEFVASLGRNAFNAELQREQLKANELCEEWDQAARDRVTYY